MHTCVCGVCMYVHICLGGVCVGRAALIWLRFIVYMCLCACLLESVGLQLYSHYMNTAGTQ